MSMVLSMENKKQTHLNIIKTFYLTLSRWYRMALEVLNSTDFGVEVQASPTGDHPGGDYMGLTRRIDFLLWMRGLYCNSTT
jgi:hypothetical protein